MDEGEPASFCRRLQLLRKCSPHEQDDQQIFLLNSHSSGWDGFWREAEAGFARRRPRSSQRPGCSVALANLTDGVLSQTANRKPRRSERAWREESPYRSGAPITATCTASAKRSNWWARIGIEPLKSLGSFGYLPSRPSSNDAVRYADACGSHRHEMWTS